VSSEAYKPLLIVAWEVITILIVDTVRLAPEDQSVQLTGYEHNGVTCIGMKTDIPVINIFLVVQFLCF